MILLEVFVDTIDYILYYWLFAFHFEKKRKVKQPVFVLAFAFAGAAEYLLYQEEQQLGIILLSLVLLSGGSLVLFKGSIRWRILFTVITVLFSVTAENVIGLIVAVILQLPVSDMIAYPGAALLAEMVYLFAKAVFIYGYGQKMHEKRSMAETEFLSLETMLIPVVSFIGTITYGWFGLVREEPDYMTTLAVWLFVALINIIYFFVLRRHAGLYQENMKNQMKRQELELKEEYYRGVERYQDEIRRIRHDLKNQLLTIGAALPQDQEAVAAEVRTILKELQAEAVVSYTRHPGLNMLLNAKCQEAEEAKILCDFQIKVPEQMTFAERDLGALIGNLLDNAIEACRRCAGRRYIQLKIIYFRQSLVIRVENSTDGAVKDLRTRKADRRNHGIGSESIHSIVRKYHGDVAYEIDEQVFVAEVSMWEALAVPERGSDI